jgi:hypothetical protein
LRDDQPITVDEGNGASTQHIIVIEVSVIVLHKTLVTLLPLYFRKAPLSYSLAYMYILIGALVRLPNNIVIQFNSCTGNNHLSSCVSLQKLQVLGSSRRGLKERRTHCKSRLDWLELPL